MLPERCKYRRALAGEAVSRIDEVIGDTQETPSSSTLPVGQALAGVSGSPSATHVDWSAITHPAVTEQIQTSRLAAAIADLMEEDGRELDRPGFWERAVKRVFR